MLILFYLFIMRFSELIEKVNQIDEDFENFKKEKSICMEPLKKFYWEINLRDASDNAREFISSNKIMSPKLGLTFSHNDSRYLSNVKLKALKSEVTKDLFILIAKIIGKGDYVNQEIEIFLKNNIN